MKIAGALLLMLTALGMACSNSLIGKERASRYAEKNRGLAALLPVPPETRLVSQNQIDCSGAFRRDATEACELQLRYETTRPQIEIMRSYVDYFRSQSWSVNATDERDALFQRDAFLVEVFLEIPLGFCPDEHTELDAALRCEAEEFRRDDGKLRRFSIIVRPDSPKTTVAALPLDNQIVKPYSRLFHKPRRQALAQ